MTTPTSRTVPNNFEMTRLASSVYRSSAAVLFLCGAGIHLAKLTIGPDRLLNGFLTPKVDGIFGAIMSVSAAMGWLALSHLDQKGWKKGIYLFMLIFMTISIPIHIRSYVVGNTELFRAFPDWYSIAEIPLFLAMAFAVTKFTFRR